MPALALLGSVLLLTGCPYDEYRIELRPHDGVIERTLTFYTFDGFDTNGLPQNRSFSSPSNAAAIVALYHSNLVASNAVRADFAGKLPDDIGGSGYYSNFATSLGSASFYSERFRGDDDLATRLDRETKALDKLTDHVLGWSKMALGREPHYQDLRKFLDADFRRDLKNVGLLAALASFPGPDDTSGAYRFSARPAQYLLDHGYLTLADFPAFAHDDDDFKSLLVPVQRMVALKLGYPTGSPVPKSLKFLADPTAFTASWSNYLVSTPEFRRLTVKRRQQITRETLLNMKYLTQKMGGALGGKGTNYVAPPMPAPVDALDPIGEDISFVFSAQPHYVDLSLSLPAPPLFSSGVWDETTRKVNWRSPMAESNHAPVLPPQFSAVWVDPNESFQKEHFGSVLISGNVLLTYCLWHAALDPQQVREWDAALNAVLSPAEFSNFTQNFHFTPLAGEGTNSPDPARTGINLFPNNLRSR